jgi:hypothetical protein
MRQTGVDVHPRGTAGRARRRPPQARRRGSRLFVAHGRTGVYGGGERVGLGWSPTAAGGQQPRSGIPASRPPAGADADGTWGDGGARSARARAGTTAPTAARGERAGPGLPGLPRASAWGACPACGARAPALLAVPIGRAVPAVPALAAGPASAWGACPAGGARSADGACGASPAGRACPAREVRRGGGAPVCMMTTGVGRRRGATVRAPAPGPQSMACGGPGLSGERWGGGAALWALAASGHRGVGRPVVTGWGPVGRPGRRVRHGGVRRRGPLGHAPPAAAPGPRPCPRTVGCHRLPPAPGHPAHRAAGIAADAPPPLCPGAIGSRRCPAPPVHPGATVGSRGGGQPRAACR